MASARPELTGCPPRFLIKRNGRFSSVLGSCHSIALRQLPAFIQNCLQEAKIVVTEINAKEPVLLSEDHLFKLGILLPPDKQDREWLTKLSEEIHFLLKHNCAIFFKERTSLTRTPELCEINPKKIITIYILGSLNKEEIMDYQISLRAIKSFSLEGSDRSEFYSKIDTPIVQVIELLKNLHLLQRQMDIQNQNYLKGIIVNKPINNDSLDMKKRNLRWIAKIIEYHETLENPFFVFGASHLYGPLGVLSLLNKYGFEIVQFNALGEQVPYSFIDKKDELLELIEKVSEQYVKSAITVTKLGAKECDLVYQYMGHRFFKAPPSFLSRHLDISLKPDGQIKIEASDEPVVPGFLRG